MSVGSGDGFDSVVMVEEPGESIYEVESEDKKRGLVQLASASGSCQIRAQIYTRLSLSRPLGASAAVGQPSGAEPLSTCPSASSPSPLRSTLFFTDLSVLLASIPSLASGLSSSPSSYGVQRIPLPQRPLLTRRHAPRSFLRKNSLTQHLLFHDLFGSHSVRIEPTAV